MDQIVWEVLAGLLIVTLTIMVVSNIKQGQSTVNTGIQKTMTTENKKFDEMGYDDLENYQIEGRKFAGYEVNSFLDYNKDSADIVEIKVAKVSGEFYRFKIDGTGTDTIKTIKDYISNGLSVDKKPLLEVKYNYHYDKSTKIVTFD